MSKTVFTDSGTAFRPADTFFSSLSLLLIFRSVFILIGILVACLNASALTLILTQVLNIHVGPLTANLSTIVFVLTLTHMIFMTFNWKYLMAHGEITQNASLEAVRMTFVPSFWSMLTTLLGFLSLLFVEATPLRQLGIAGALGTFVAFSLAYLVYPFFLHMEDFRITRGRPRAVKAVRDFTIYERIEKWLVVILVMITLAAAFGIQRIDTDPSLFSYFKKDTELRNGMEYIDRNGGSVPLKVIIRDQDNAKLDSGEKYKELLELNEALEEDSAVGNVISIALIVAEAKRGLLSFFISTEAILNSFEDPFFISADRRRALLLFRMNEADRASPRLEVVDRLQKVVENHGFVAELVGGIYLLQGKLEQLVISSVTFGLLLLMGTFIVMGLVLSHSVQVMLAMFVSLSMIALCTLGAIGHLRMPLDIISAPAVNVGIAMGVDAAIHMLVYVHRHMGQVKRKWDLWDRACARLWKPIVCDMVVVCTGFGVFSLSSFPPTQRFGFAVVVGALVAALMALFVLPCLASVSFRVKLDWRRRRA